jgi:3'-5' exoribonuclease
MAKLLITERDGTATSFFLATEIETRQRRSGEAYLSCVLADRSGELPAVMWEGLTPEIRGLVKGDIVKAEVHVGTYQGQRQLTIKRLRKATPDEISPEDYLPRSAQDPEALLGSLDATVEGLGEPHLRQLLTAILADPVIRAGFTHAPAGKRLHHARLGGLLEHVASVVTACDFMSRHYAPRVHRDLLIAAAIREVRPNANLLRTDVREPGEAGEW